MSPSELNASDLRALLELELVSTLDVYVSEETDSTMLDARRYVEQGGQHEALFVTLRQHSGKGRRGSVWIMPSDAIAMTLLIKTEISSLPLVTLSVGVAVHEAISQFSPNARIKWPNDIVDQAGNKLGGILCESIGSQWLSIGIGLNVGTAPAGAVSVSELAQREITRDSLLPMMVRAVMMHVRCPQDTISYVNKSLHRPQGLVPFVHGTETMQISVLRVTETGSLAALAQGEPKEFTTGHFLKEGEL